MNNKPLWISRSFFVFLFFFFLKLFYCGILYLKNKNEGGKQNRKKKYIYMNNKPQHNEIPLLLCAFIWCARRVVMTHSRRPLRGRKRVSPAASSMPHKDITINPPPRGKEAIWLYIDIQFISINLLSNSQYLIPFVDPHGRGGGCYGLTRVLTFNWHFFPRVGFV